MLRMFFFFRKYNNQRETYNLKVPYFVKDDFRVEYKGEMRRIERSVEEEYISQLRSNCWRERTYSKGIIYMCLCFCVKQGISTPVSKHCMLKGLILFEIVTMLK
jgi:hypothetical protein